MKDKKNIQLEMQNRFDEEKCNVENFSNTGDVQNTKWMYYKNSCYIIMCGIYLLYNFFLNKKATASGRLLSTDEAILAD